MPGIIDAPETAVADALRGLALCHPELRVDHERRLVLRARPKPAGAVAIVSGGGSGHEPLHGGFVGPGMLDGACVGEVFTSPVPEQITAAVTAVDRGAGVLQIVKNYSGDVMNAEMATELLAADRPDVTVRTVHVADDVAVPDESSATGRRGVAGTLLVEKIAGAAAEEGADLDTVTGIARRTSAGVRSFGVALTPRIDAAHGRWSARSLPANGEDEIELGVGIHGEPGCRRSPRLPAREIAREMLAPIPAELPGDGPVLLLVNGLGATPLLELHILAADAHDLLAEAGIEVSRSLVGSFVTSLGAAGASLTLLRLDDELTRLWDAPCSTPGLRKGM